MWPAIRDGAILTIEPCPAGACRRGDLAAYVSADQRLIVHRVIAPLSDGQLTFRGDGLELPDAPVPEREVLGKATIEWQRPFRLRAPRVRELRLLLRALLRNLTQRW